MFYPNRNDRYPDKLNKNHKSTSKTRKLDAEIMQFRLEGVRDAQKMSRLAFAISIIGSLTIALALWNAYFSWYRSFPANAALSSGTTSVQSEIIRQWVESSYITLPFIGIKVGISDGAVFGSAGLSLLTLWLYLSIKREKKIIKSILNNTNNWSTNNMEWIFYGISSYIFFINITQIDQQTIKFNRQLAGGEYRPNKIMLTVFRVLVYLPAITIASLILLDFISMVWITASYRNPGESLLAQVDKWDIIKFFFMEVVATAFLVYTTRLCYKTVARVFSIGRILIKYFKLYNRGRYHK